MKTFDDYLALGMDQDTARYFANGRRRIVSAVPGRNYTILLSFDNGERRLLDCKSNFTEGSIFNKLADQDAFNRVFVDSNGNLAWDLDPRVDSNVAWSNRVDFCRDSCYLKSVPV